MLLRNRARRFGSNIKAPGIVAMVLMLMSACSTTGSAGPIFSESLEAHLAAIANRDLAAFEETLTSSDDLYVIFPDGEPLTTTSAVIDFHKKWFADSQWIFEPTVIKTIEGHDMSTALVKYRYRDTAKGVPRESWLVLVFRLEGTKWLLVHDQNTRLAN